MPLVAVQDGLFYGVFATRVVCAAGSVHPVYSPCPACGVSEVSAACGNLVVVSVCHPSESRGFVWELRVR